MIFLISFGGCQWPQCEFCTGIAHSSSSEVGRALAKAHLGMTRVCSSDLFSPPLFAPVNPVWILGCRGAQHRAFPRLFLSWPQLRHLSLLLCPPPHGTSVEPPASDRAGGSNQHLSPLQAPIWLSLAQNHLSRKGETEHKLIYKEITAIRMKRLTTAWFGAGAYGAQI